MKSTLVRITLGMLIPLCVFSQSRAAGPGTSTAAFLRVGPDARAEGMGEAQAAVAEGVQALYWNPAGLGGGIRQRELILVHNTLGPDTNLEYIATAYPLPVWGGTLGGSVTYFWMPPLQVTSLAAPNGTGETLDLYDLAISLGFGMVVQEENNLGVSVKYIQRRLGDAQGTGFAADVGYIFRSLDFPDLKVGFAAQNLGPQIVTFNTPEDLPFTLRGGISYILIRETGHQVQVALDGVLPNDTPPYPNAGVEYWFLETLAVRLGYSARQDFPAAMGGVGLQSKFNLLTAGLDYSFTYPVNGLTGFQRFSLKFAF